MALCEPSEIGVCSICQKKQRISIRWFAFMCSQCDDMVRYHLGKIASHTDINDPFVIDAAMKHVRRIRRVEKDAVRLAKRTVAYCSYCGHKDKGKNFCYTTNGSMCYRCREALT